jgi:phage-related protein
VRKDHGPQNQATLRNITHNMLKWEYKANACKLAGAKTTC